MRCHNIERWLLVFASVFVVTIPEITFGSNFRGYKPLSLRKDSRNGKELDLPSLKRDYVDGFNRENYGDSQDQFITDTTVASNQLPNADIGRIKSDDKGQQKLVLPEQESSYPDDRNSPFGDTQVPTISANDFKIAYDDGLAPTPSPNRRVSDSLLTYDIPEDPLEESNTNTVKIADSSANRKLFSNDGFSHGTGQLTNAINGILIDKVLNSDADKDFTKELKLLTEEFSEAEKENARNEEGKKPTCQPDAKSIFANCKKKRSAVCSPEDRPTFFKNAVGMHNLFRKIHGVQDIVLNDKLSKDAQEYAEHLARTSMSVHSVRADRPGQGENIAVGCTSAGSELRAREAVSQWYSKACEKGFDFTGYKKGVEPFAQLVWKATTYLGMGKAVSKRDDNLCTYIVARYSPEGDKSNFEENVLKGTFSRDSICNVSCVVKSDVSKITDSTAPLKEEKESNKVSETKIKEENKAPSQAIVKEQKNSEQTSGSSSPKVAPSQQSIHNDTEKVFSANSKNNAGSQKPSDLSNDKVYDRPKPQDPSSDQRVNLTSSADGPKSSNASMNVKPKQPAESSKPSEMNSGSEQLPNPSQPNSKSPALTNATVLNNEKNYDEKHLDPQSREATVSVNKEAEPNQPTLINIKFPKQLESTNNSVIQITLGDKGEKPVLQQSSFKPIVNFTGKQTQIVTAQEEFFDNDAQSDKIVEGKAIEKGPKLIVHFLDTGNDQKQPATYDYGSAPTQKVFSSQEDREPNTKDLTFGENTPSLDKQVSFQESTSKTENVNLKEKNVGVNLNTESENGSSHKMFQDRKGMESKNHDDSETYLKIANKLMHGDGDNGPQSSPTAAEVFLPKQLESSKVGGYVKSRKDPDYGFTDEDVKQLSKEKELSDLLDAVKNRTVTASNATANTSMNHGEKEAISPSPGSINDIVNGTGSEPERNEEFETILGSSKSTSASTIKETFDQLNDSVNNLSTGKNTESKDKMFPGADSSSHDVAVNGTLRPMFEVGSSERNETTRKESVQLDSPNHYNDSDHSEQHSEKGNLEENSHSDQRQTSSFIKEKTNQGLVPPNDHNDFNTHLNHAAKQSESVVAQTHDLAANTEKTGMNGRFAEGENNLNHNEGIIPVIKEDIQDMKYSPENNLSVSRQTSTNDKEKESKESRLISEAGKNEHGVLKDIDDPSKNQKFVKLFDYMTEPNVEAERVRDNENLKEKSPELENPEKTSHNDFGKTKPNGVSSSNLQSIKHDASQHTLGHEQPVEYISQKVNPGYFKTNQNDVAGNKDETNVKMEGGNNEDLSLTSKQFLNKGSDQDGNLGAHGLAGNEYAKSEKTGGNYRDRTRFEHSKNGLNSGTDNEGIIPVIKTINQGMNYNPKNDPSVSRQTRKNGEYHDSKRPLDKKENTIKEGVDPGKTVSLDDETAATSSKNLVQEKKPPSKNAFSQEKVVKLSDEFDQGSLTTSKSAFDQRNVDASKSAFDQRNEDASKSASNRKKAATFNNGFVHGQEDVSTSDIGPNYNKLIDHFNSPKREHPEHSVEEFQKLKNRNGKEYQAVDGVGNSGESSKTIYKNTHGVGRQDDGQELHSVQAFANRGASGSDSKEMLSHDAAFKDLSGHDSNKLKSHTAGFSLLDIPAKNIAIDQQAYHNIADIVKDKNKHSQEDNTTTINVGNGFIKIKYDKPKNDNSRKNTESKEKMFPDAGFSSHDVAVSGNVRPMLEARNKSLHMSNEMDADSTANLLHDSEVSAKAHGGRDSLTPVIDRQSDHHYVIQFRPTHPSGDESSRNLQSLDATNHIEPHGVLNNRISYGAHQSPNYHDVLKEDLMEANSEALSEYKAPGAAASQLEKGSSKSREGSNSETKHSADTSAISSNALVSPSQKFESTLERSSKLAKTDASSTPSKTDTSVRFNEQLSKGSVSSNSVGFQSLATVPSRSQYQGTVRYHEDSAAALKGKSSRNGEQNYGLLQTVETDTQNTAEENARLQAPAQHATSEKSAGVNKVSDVNYQYPSRQQSLKSLGKEPPSWKSKSGDYKPLALKPEPYETKVTGETLPSKGFMQSKDLKPVNAKPDWHSIQTAPPTKESGPPTSANGISKSDSQYEKDQRLVSKYEPSTVVHSPINYAHEIPEKATTSKNSAHVLREYQIGNQRFDARNGNIDPEAAKTHQLVTTKKMPSPLQVKQRQNQHDSLTNAAMKNDSLTSDDDEFEVTPKMRNAPLVSSGKDEIENKNIHDTKLLKQEDKSPKSEKHASRVSQGDLNPGQQIKGEGKSRQESVACRSDCLNGEHRSLQQGIGDRWISDEEHSVIGLNVQKGYDTFSGFVKRPDGHSLEKGLDKHVAAANLRHHVRESPKHDVSKTSNMIFIPEQVLVKFRKDMMEEHNKYRRIHSVPGLSLSSMLTADSQRYAYELASHGSVAHSPVTGRRNVGESIEKLCKKDGGMPSASDLLKRWYDEVCHPGYDFERDGKQPGTGHFTQLVWKDTKKVGIGLAASKSKNGDICSFVVARYYKAGNHLGSIKRNVKRGYFHSCDNNPRRPQAHQNAAGQLKESRQNANNKQKYQTTFQAPINVYRKPTFFSKNRLISSGKASSKPQKVPHTSSGSFLRHSDGKFKDVNLHPNSGGNNSGSKQKGIVQLGLEKAVDTQKLFFPKQIPKKFKEASGGPMSNIPTSKAAKKFPMQLSDQSNENGHHVSAIINIPNPADFDSMEDIASSELQANDQHHSSNLPETYSKHEQDVSLMYKRPAPKYLSPSGRENVGNMNSNSEEFEVNFAAPKFKSKQPLNHTKEHSGSSHHSHGNRLSFNRPAKDAFDDRKILYANGMGNRPELVTDTEGLKLHKEETTNLDSVQHKSPSHKFLSEGRPSTSKLIDDGPKTNQDSFENVTKSYSHGGNENSVPSVDKQAAFINSEVHGSNVNQAASNLGLSFNADKSSPKIQSSFHNGLKEPLSQPVNAQSDFPEAVSRDTKPDNSYLSGIQAGLNYELNLDKSSYEDSTASIPIEEKLMKDTSNYDDFFEGKNVDSKSIAMSAEADRIESVISKEGTQIESNLLRQPKPQVSGFEGSQKGEDENKIPSISMDEYSYDSPVTYGAGNLYDRHFDKENNNQKGALPSEIKSISDNKPIPSAKKISANMPKKTDHVKSQDVKSSSDPTTSASAVRPLGNRFKTAHNKEQTAAGFSSHNTHVPYETAPHHQSEDNDISHSNRFLNEEHLAKDNSGSLYRNRGFSNGYSGLSHDHSGFSNDYSGLSNAHTGLFHDQNGLSRHQSGLSHDHSGFSNDYSGLSNAHTGLFHDQNGLSHHQSSLSNDHNGFSNDHSGLSHHQISLSNDHNGLSHHQSSLSKAHNDISHDQSGLSYHQSSLSNDQSGLSHHNSGLSYHQSSLSNEHIDTSNDQSGLSHHQSSLSNDHIGFSSDHSGLTHYHSGHPLSNQNYHSIDHHGLPEHQSGLTGINDLQKGQSGFSSDNFRPSSDPNGPSSEQINLPVTHNSGKTSQKSTPFTQTGFGQGFQDALKNMGDEAWDNFSDMGATKKAVLSRAPTESGIKNEGKFDSNGREYGSRAPIEPSSKERTEKVSKLDYSNDDVNSINHQSQNLRNSKNETYDSNRTRHFVIDRNDNLVLQPGEDNGAISNFEQANLAMITDQATYGLGSLSKLARENQGIQGFQTRSSNYDKSNRPGLIAWTGPNNPGLPDEGILQANDYTGQSTVETFEKPTYNHPEELQAFEKTADNGPVERLAKRPELEQATEELNAALDFQKGGSSVHKATSYRDSGHRASDEETLDGQLSDRVQFSKDVHASKLEEKSRNDKESISDNLKFLQETSKRPEKEANNGKEDSNLNKDKEGTSTFMQNALMWHNKLRCVHGSDSLRLNDSLTKEADEFANKIVSTLHGILQHSKLETRSGEGENLAMTCTGDKSTLKGAEATFKWYNDICEKGYDFKSNEVQHGTGHFTQLVWKGTTDFGIGRAQTKKNGRFCTVIVARYFPRGNIQKDFVENVDQGDYNDQTCETLKNQLTSQSKFVGCGKSRNKNLFGNSEKSKSEARLKKLSSTQNGGSNNGASHASSKLKKLRGSVREKEKARITHEIQQVSGLIDKLESNGKDVSTLQTPEYQKETKMADAKEGMKSSSNNGHLGFTGLGGTGSPMVIYHGATGFFEDPKTFANIGSETHNNLREIHGSPKVKLDLNLTAAAFQYATELTQLGYLKHDEKIPKDQGENLAIGCYDNNSEMSAEDAVNRWYNEVCQPGYLFDNGIAESGTGHFSQVVWKATTKMGMAKQTRMHGNLKCTYVVARYSPAGNIHGEFKKNVQKGDFNQTVCREVMRNLLKFQQRNEKILEKQESGLKLEKAAAKIQGKILAAMQSKAMQVLTRNQKGKQNNFMKQKRPSGSASSDESTSFHQQNKQQTVKTTDVLPFQRASLASKSLPSLSATSSGSSHQSGSNNQTVKSSKPHLITGLSDNGLHTIIENDVSLMRLGPTVKIVEEGEHGGTMYKKVLEPQNNMHAKYHSNTVRNGHLKNRFMHNGLAGQISKQMNSSMQVKPKVIEHRLIDAKTIGAVISRDTPRRNGNLPSEDGLHLKQSVHPGMSGGEFEIPEAAYRKSVAAHNNASRPSAKEHQYTKKPRRPMQSPLPHYELKHDIDIQASKLTARPIDKPLYNTMETHQYAQRPSYKSPDYNVRHRDTAYRVKPADHLPNRYRQDSSKQMLVGTQKGMDQFSSSSENHAGKHVFSATKKSTYQSMKNIVKPLQGSSQSASLKSSSQEKPKQIPAHSNTISNEFVGPKQPFLRADLKPLHSKPGSSLVDSKRIVIRTDAKPLQSRPTKPLMASKQSLSHVNLKPLQSKSGSGFVASNQPFLHADLKPLQSKPGSSLMDSKKIVARTDAKPLQIRPTKPLMASKPSLSHTNLKPLQRSQFIYTQPKPMQSQLGVSIRNIVKPVKTGNVQSISPLNYPGSSPKIKNPDIPSLQKYLVKKAPPSLSLPTPIKGPTAMDMLPPGGSLAARPPYIVTVMETPTPQSYDPQAVSDTIGRLITGETQAEKQEFQRSALETHNMYRRLHKSGPLKLNYGMSILAEQYARKIAQLGKLEHSGTDDGENIASVCRKENSFMSGSEATNVWYKELCNPGYDFVSGQPGSSGHFTQLVWRATQQLGVGRAEAKRDGFICTYVVARYRPAGNFLGDFIKNVFKGGFDSSKCSTSHKKKSTIEVGQYVPRAPTARYFKRSRILGADNSNASKKAQVWENEEEQPGDSRLDEVVDNRANSVWMNDLEAGFRGSDVAGVVPLSVSIGTDENLRNYANKIMNDVADNDKALAENFAAKLLDEVKKERSEASSGEKNKIGAFLNGKASPKNNDIDKARADFANMAASIKKSTPTERTGDAVNNGGNTNLAASQGGNGMQSVGLQAAASRSEQNPTSALLLSQVNQAAQSLSKAATSIETAAKMQDNAASQPNTQASGIKNDANAPPNAAQNALMNEAMAIFAAKMKEAAAKGNTANGPASIEGGDTGVATGVAIGAPATQGFAPSAGGSSQPLNAANGNLASSNMAAANQAALSQAAKEKKIESANYKPSELQQSGLNAHNRFRNVHDVPPLVLNEKLSQDAAAWAKTCADLGMAKPSSSGDGENVIESCKPRGQEMTASEATEIWYSELCNPGYDFDAAEITGTERFTQVVWKGTTELGIGKVTRPKADLLCTYIVARYRPPGNVLGDVKQSVVRGRLNSKHFCKQFLAMSKFKARLSDNLPSKIERMEQASTLGNTLEAGKPTLKDELVAGGDNPGMDGATSNKKEFREEALYTHNRFRAMHSTAPLQLDVKMCDEAEQFAADLASKGSLMRSKDSIKGQNIAMTCNKDGIEMTGDEATNKWYNEVCNPGYDFKGSYPFGAAHFMQVVWASSKAFGIGKATTTLDDMLCTWVVGLYDPSGDMRNMQKENVLMGLFDYTYCDTFGKGGGGKGASSGAIHNMAGDKIAAPAGSDMNAKKKSDLSRDLTTGRSVYSKRGQRAKVSNILIDDKVRNGTPNQLFFNTVPNIAKRHHRVLQRGHFAVSREHSSQRNMQRRTHHKLHHKLRLKKNNKRIKARSFHNHHNVHHHHHAHRRHKSITKYRKT